MCNVLAFFNNSLKASVLDSFYKENVSPITIKWSPPEQHYEGKTL